MGLTVFAQQQAQTSAIAFDKVVHDFGNIELKAGAQSFTFEFTNSGKEPIIIQNVGTSCGCATPGWTKKPVLPGVRGYVKATFTPSAVTPFDKSLTVYINDSPTPITLRIKGTVVESSGGGK